MKNKIYTTYFLVNDMYNKNHVKNCLYIKFKKLSFAKVNFRNYLSMYVSFICLRNLLYIFVVHEMCKVNMQEIVICSNHR